MLFFRWVVFVVIGMLSLHAYPKTPAPPGYAVASAHPLATGAGIAIMARGGNAFDAAVGVSAVLAVVAPYHAALGGGGFWLLHDAASNEDIVIDGRETAPARAHEKMYLDKAGHVRSDLSLNGGLAAAIPGEPAALVYLAKHYGTLPLTQSLAPAIRLAEEGFIVDQAFYDFTMMSDRLSQLNRFEGSRAVFTRQGRPYQVGDRLIQRDLARTLRELAKYGHQGFYSGKVARQLVQGVNRAGGIWRPEDLAAYQVKVRKPLTARFHDMYIITVPPPSAGGISLITMLNILAAYPLHQLPRVEWIHVVAESMRLAYWQRNQFLGDPDFVSVPLQQLLSQDNVRFLRKQILLDKALPSHTLSDKKASQAPEPAIDTIEQQDLKHTTHIAILDRAGNRVSATMTVNYIFGSSVVPPDTGVLLNDQMDDFSTEPGAPNVFGIPGSRANAIAPGKRPVSSATPAFLEMPGRVAIFGTPGGSRIPTMVLLAALAFYDGAGAIQMVSSMRFHHQYLPDQLVFEPDTFTKNIQNRLKKMGYALLPLQQIYGDMQAITWDQTMPFLMAASDPRHIGRATVIREDQPNVRGYGASH